jgi:hypothetical protein
MPTQQKSDSSPNPHPAQVRLDNALRFKDNLHSFFPYVIKTTGWIEYIAANLTSFLLSEAFFISQSRKPAHSELVLPFFSSLAAAYLPTEGATNFNSFLILSTVIGSLIEIPQTFRNPYINCWIGYITMQSLTEMHEQTRDRPSLPLSKDTEALTAMAIEALTFAFIATTINSSNPYWLVRATQLMTLGACLLDRAAVLWADRSIEKARKELKEAGVERPTSTPAHGVATNASADHNQWIQH